MYLCTRGEHWINSRTRPLYAQAPKFNKLRSVCSSLNTTWPLSPVVPCSPDSREAHRGLRLWKDGTNTRRREEGNTRKLCATKRVESPQQGSDHYCHIHHCCTGHNMDVRADSCHSCKLLYKRLYNVDMMADNSIDDHRFVYTFTFSHRDINTFTQQRRSQPCEATANSYRTDRVRCFDGGSN